VHLDSVIMSLYLIDKPGKVYNGRLNPDKELKFNILEKRGRKPGHKSVQDFDMARVVEMC
jgi:hypothetical protein